MTVSLTCFVAWQTSAARVSRPLVPAPPPPASYQRRLHCAITDDDCRNDTLDSTHNDIERHQITGLSRDIWTTTRQPTTDPLAVRPSRLSHCTICDLIDRLLFIVVLIMFFSYVTAVVYAAVTNRIQIS